MPNTLTKEHSETREWLAPEIVTPSLFDVVFFNDDVTPMEFVVALLVSMYGHERKRAEEIMLQVHLDGTSVAGTYPFDIAEAKVVETTMVAREAGFPLRCATQRRAGTD